MRLPAITGAFCTPKPNPARHTTFPVAVSSACNPQDCRYVCDSPATAGPVMTSPARTFHFSLPVETSRAYRLPSLLPMMAESPVTAGGEETPSPVSYFHRTLPVFAST